MVSLYTFYVILTIEHAIEINFRNYSTQNSQITDQ